MIVCIKDHVINTDKLCHARLDLMPNNGVFPSNIYFTFVTHSFAIEFDKQEEAKECFNKIVKGLNDRDTL